MKILLLLFTVIFFGLFADAQQAQKLPMQRIDYTKSIPAVVRKQMPTGAKSCFYGNFKLPAQNRRFLMHLFDPNPKREFQRYDGHTATSHFMLHLFESGKTKLRLINRVQINYSGIVERPIKFSAHLLWLDPKQKLKPILKVDCFDPNGFSGLIGDEVVIVFPKGLTDKAVTQSFVYGAWRASDSSGQTNTFNDMDKNGLLQIRSYTFIPTNEIPQPPPTILEWNGEKFAPVKSENASSTK